MRFSSNSGKDETRQFAIPGNWHPALVVCKRDLLYYIPWKEINKYLAFHMTDEFCILKNKMVYNTLFCDSLLSLEFGDLVGSMSRNKYSCIHVTFGNDHVWPVSGGKAKAFNSSWFDSEFIHFSDIRIPKYPKDRGIDCFNFSAVCPGYNVKLYVHVISQNRSVGAVQIFMITNVKIPRWFWFWGQRPGAPFTIMV